MREKITHSAKRLFHLAGYIILLASFYYVGANLYTNFAKVSAVTISSRTLTTAAVCGVVYACAFLLLAISWHIIVTAFSHKHVSLRDALYIYTRSSIAKYLPGNVGHFVGRHFVARPLELPHSLLALSTLIEILFQICTALMISFWAPPVQSPIPTEFALCITVLATLLSIFFLPTFINKIQTQTGYRLNSKFSKSRIFSIITLNGTFFLITGALLGALYYSIDSSPLGCNFHVLSVYAISWFVGLVTPGAPAGIGVREAIIVALLNQTLAQPDALALALLFRIATTIGDVFFYSFSYFFKNTTLRAT